MTKNSLKFSFALLAILLSYSISFSQASVFMEKNKFGVKSADGTVIIKPIYSSFDPIRKHSSLAIVSLGKKFGVINSKNDVIIPIIYQEVQMISDSLMKVNLSGKYGIFSVTGKEIVAPSYSRMSNRFSYDLLGAALGSKWGYLNEKGEVEVPFEYDYVQDIDKTYGIVQKNKKYGVIEKDGKVVVPVEFDYVSFGTYSNIKMYFTTTNKEKEGVYTIYLIPKYSSDGTTFLYGEFVLKELCKPLYDRIIPLKDGNWEITSNDLNGIMDSDGKVLVTPTYKSISELGDNFYSVTMEDHNVFTKNPTGRQPDGLISPTGKLLSELKYDGIDDISNGLFKVRDFKTFQYGVLDSTGKVIIPCEYYDIHDIGQDVIVATNYKEPTTREEKLASGTSESGLDGLINRQNKQLIPFIYTYIRLSKNDFAIARNDKRKSGILSMKNEILLPFDYDELDFNYTKEFIIATKGDKKILMTENGTIVKTPAYTDIDWFNYNSCLFLADGKIGIIDCKGKIIQEAIFDGFDNNIDSDQYQYSLVEKDGKVGFIDLGGVIVIPCQFDEATPFKDNYSKVTIDGKTRYIDKEGKYLN